MSVDKPIKLGTPVTLPNGVTVKNINKTPGEIIAIAESMGIISDDVKALAITLFTQRVELESKIEQINDQLTKIAGEFYSKDYISRG